MKEEWKKTARWSHLLESYKPKSEGLAKMSKLTKVFV